MNLLAFRNLFHDRIRLAVTLTGIVFAIVLIIVQLGIFIGFTRTTSVVIDNSGVDLWIHARGLRFFDSAAGIPAARLYQALGTPGVATAQKMIVEFTTWKRRDGGQEAIEVIGMNPDEPLATPWSLVAGRVADLKFEDTVVVDEFYKRKLGVDRLGEVFEINGRRARVVGFTRGVRSFTTSPYVFTWFKNAQNYSHLPSHQVHYIVVKAEPGVLIEDVRRRLLARIPDVEVETNAELSQKTQYYWMYSTGAGVAILIAAAMGLIVGTVVVAQTIYASTVDHIREFGTLKAMGATNTYIYRIIIRQATVSAVLGYSIGLAIAYGVVRLSAGGDANIVLPWPLAVSMFWVSLAMCIGASFVSVNKVTAIDPAQVFKG